MAVNDRALLPDRVNEFLNYLINVKGCGTLTVESYARDLRLFFAYLLDKNTASESAETTVPRDLRCIDDRFLAAVSVRDIYDFLTYCGSERGNNLTTRRRKSSALRGFFKYVCDKMHYIDSNPTRSLELAGGKQKLPRYLTLEQSEALLQGTFTSCLSMLSHEP